MQSFNAWFVHSQSKVNAWLLFVKYSLFKLSFQCLHVIIYIYIGLFKAWAKKHLYTTSFLLCSFQYKLSRQTESHILFHAVPYLYLYWEVLELRNFKFIRPKLLSKTQKKNQKTKNLLLPGSNIKICGFILTFFFFLWKITPEQSRLPTTKIKGPIYNSPVILSYKRKIFMPS